MRRAPLNSFFSVASVRRLQPLIEERVQVFLQRMRGLKETGEVMTMAVVTSAFSNGKFCAKKHLKVHVRTYLND